MVTRLTSHAQARNTRRKLEELESLFKKAEARQMSTSELKELSLFSMRRLMNQMKEELMLFEADVKSGRIPQEPVEA